MLSSQFPVCGKFNSLLQGISSIPGSVGIPAKRYFANSCSSEPFLVRMCLSPRILSPTDGNIEGVGNWRVAGFAIRQKTQVNRTDVLAVL